MVSQSDKCTKFRQLHERPGAFVIPNPWDAGSARMLESLGFEALATTSAGLANCLGRVDGELELFEVLDHCKDLVANTDVPISVDFENGFADDPETVATNVLLLAETGVAGCSIEDFGNGHIYDFMLAVERVEAAVAAAKALEVDFLITARAENLLRGVNDPGDTLRRLEAYEAAGADVLYSPGLRTLDEVRAMTGAVNKPTNILGVMIPGASVDALAAAGAKRISVGGALANHALAAAYGAAQAVAESGEFAFVTELLPSAVMKNIFQT